MYRLRPLTIVYPSGAAETTETTNYFKKREKLFQHRFLRNLSSNPSIFAHVSLTLESNQYSLIGLSQNSFDPVVRKLVRRIETCLERLRTDPSIKTQASVLLQRAVHWPSFLANPAAGPYLGPICDEIISLHMESCLCFFREANESTDDTFLRWLLHLHPRFINWRLLSANPAPRAVAYLKTNMENVDWYQLSSNTHPDAIQLLSRNPLGINWFYASMNPAARGLIESNLSRVYWPNASANTDPAVLDLLLIHSPQSINVRMLCANTSDRAMRILLDRFGTAVHLWSFFELSANHHPVAVKLLQQHWKHIHWDSLARNTNLDALTFLFLRNTKLVEYNYDYLKTRSQMMRLREQITAATASSPNDSSISPSV
jgi:hypothetical protein